MYLCNKKKMKFSIITINYNNYEGLRRTVESVIGQTYKDFEYIVIDGGSTDCSVDIIKENDLAISYWISERDNGIYHAMNKGVIQAHGDYCIFMNSGDCFYDSYVLEGVSCNLNNEDVIVGKVVINDNHDIISPPPPKNELTFYHLYSGAIPHQGAFIKRELLIKYPYDEKLKISSDWKFFVQTLIIDNFSINYIDVFIARYDLNGFSSSNPELMRKEKDEVLASMFPPRVIADYQRMKQSECLTQTITPLLRLHYRIDKLVYKIACLILRIKTDSHE